ncbi:MAG: lactate dehydrogenase [Chloroflexi bacterium]|nr:lactate dehydrogenase [Chloroflexota bacterium]
MTSTKVVFLTGLRPRLIEEVLSYAPSHYQIVVVDRTISEEEKIKQVLDADFLLCYGQDPSDKVLRSLKKCRLVQLLAAGYDRINLGILEELGIPCSNNGGANSWAVADHAVLLMLAVYKQLLASVISTRKDAWSLPITGENTFEMANKKIGILGLGNIGKQVAKRVQGFDATVIYHDIYRMNGDDEKKLDVSYVSLSELFKQSDILTCHTPLTGSTKHIVNDQTLGMMKPSSVVINTSRGEVVDERALIRALNAGVVSAAGLDVFEREPVDKENPLLSMDNVIVTPHMAGTTWDTWARRAKFGFENMKRVNHGNLPESVVRNFDAS